MIDTVKGCVFFKIKVNCVDIRWGKYETIIAFPQLLIKVWNLRERKKRKKTQLIKPNNFYVS